MIKRQVLIFFAICSAVYLQAQPGWPSVNEVTRPWTRWWWMGSAVTEKGLTENLQQLKNAGFGGVEVTPIYGVRGFEKQHVSFLSPQWLNLFDHTLSEARRMGMGVDLANATGWPFGGPWVADEDASKTLYVKSYSLQAGEKLKGKIEYVRPGLVRTANTKKPEIHTIQLPFEENQAMQEMALDQVQFPGPLKLEALIATSPEGQHIDLTSSVDAGGELQWTPPSGLWQLNALFSGLHGKMVERAAPGGEGYAIDHFSQRAIRRYLHHFDSAFHGRKLVGLRGYFNDSYEVDDALGQANWTHGMFDDFLTSKGYDLRHYLPALMGQSTPEMNSRVRYDYRSVVDELILKNFTQEWKDWGTHQGKSLRNQSHGSPANTLDLYSVVDIPETEGVDWLRFKFAASAANITGKPLVAAEAATWLNEHFLSSWGDVKKALDLYFLAGINHLVYHGNAYSPTEAPWPGWNFYAAVHFQPTHPQWSHITALNNYVTRVQSFLQQGKPKHDVLLYYPIADRYAAPDGPLLQHFDGMERNFEHTDFEAVSKSLQAKGIGFDFISDRQLKSVQFKDFQLQVNGMAYKFILVPEMQHLDLPALLELERLAKAGATIAFHGSIPKELPGLYRLRERKLLRQSMLATLNWTTTKGLRSSMIGKGKWLESDSLEDLLAFQSIQENPLEQAGLQSHWRQTDSSRIAFVSNRQDHAIDTWVALPGHQYELKFFNAMTGEITLPARRKGIDGKSEVRLQLPPQGSLLLIWQKSFDKTSPHVYVGQPVLADTLEGPWELEFLSGGPILPKSQSLKKVSYWTDLEDSVFQSFSGTAVYRKRFNVSPGKDLHWRLDLGAVASSARVRLNGNEIGVTLGPIHELDIPANLLKKNNVLEVEVANLMANRIAYMDRNGLPWKIFYNINMSAKKKENLKAGVFDASTWSALPSGLAGPVQLKAYSR